MPVADAIYKADRLKEIKVLFLRRPEGVRPFARESADGPALCAGAVGERAIADVPGGPGWLKKQRRAVFADIRVQPRLGNEALD